MAWEMVRYALGWNRARRSWIALWCSLKYPHACSSSLSCACHSALRSPSQRCFVEMLFVSQRALQRTYRRAGTLRSMDCAGSRCCIRLMMRLAVRLEVIGLSASRMSQGELYKVRPMLGSISSRLALKTWLMGAVACCRGGCQSPGAKEDQAHVPPPVPGKCRGLHHRSLQQHQEERRRKYLAVRTICRCWSARSMKCAAARHRARRRRAGSQTRAHRRHLERLAARLRRDGSR